MKKMFILGFLSLFMCMAVAQNFDPLKVETYKLPNGLTVYLNQDNSMPTVQGMVVVKGGSKRDPKDATGIAHYFEHIMFKGTDKIGTINFDEEKVFLDSISALYDDLGKTTDKDKRLGIQQEINRISMKAAEYAIPNEVDKILSEMGGKGMNAGTGYEVIVYFNSFPSNQIEKWLEVYYERFRYPVFRLFQSELETVFEEKNMYEDSPFQLLMEQILAKSFKGTPYGDQTIIGTSEHLKNPSLSKMAEYFDTYYVANNMALVLSGDFDPEFVKPIIEQKYGAWRSGKTPEKLDIKPEPFKGRVTYKKRMTPIKVGVRAYHTISKNHPDEVGFDVCARLLSNNASSGLLDQLSTDNKLMFAGMENMLFEETGGSLIIIVPKIVGQSLRSAEKLVEAQIQRLRKGDFDDELLKAVKTEMIKSHEQNLEDMRWRAYSIADVFVYDQSWDEFLKTPEEIAKVTKEDIVKIANQYFGDNFMSFHSKMGFPKKDKVEKPPFKPVQPQNSEKKSEYAQSVENMPIVDMDPKFIDFEKDVIITEMGNGIKTYITPNTINRIFSITLAFGKGSYNDPLLPKAASMFYQASPTGMDYTTFRRKLQLLGASLSAYADMNTTFVSISGLEDNMEEILVLANQFLNNISLDQKRLKQLAQENKMQLKTEAKDVGSKGSAVGEFALYGKSSNFLARMSQKEIEKLTAGQVVEKMNEILGYQFDVHYCGTRDKDEFMTLFSKSMKIGENARSKMPIVEKERQVYNENTIYILDDKKALQSHIYIFVEGDVNPEKSHTKLEAFNDYMGGNMSSIIFQEIREFRSLAYGSSGRYNASFFFTKPGFFRGWLSTQSDKTVEAVEVFTSILDSMPQKPERIDQVRKNLTLSINASQPSFRQKSRTVARWISQGYKDDPRKARFEGYQNMTFDQIVDFYNANIKGRPWVIAIAGDMNRINMESLKKFGNVKVVKMDDVMKK
jgi:predicted Zn-dependent peptidase